MDTNNNGLEDVSSASKIGILGIYVKFPSQQGYVSFFGSYPPRAWFSCSSFSLSVAYAS